jgi:uncharacterized protein YkwD
MSLASPNIRTILAALVAAALCALTIAPAAQAGGACSSASASPAKASKRAVVRATLCLVNAQRRSRGLRPLKINRRLSKAARRHAADMAKHNYFSHTSRNGASFIDRIRRTGYLRGARSWMVGENIAWGGGSRGTPRAIVRSWMNSPGHRANILSASFRAIGIGIARGAPAAGAGRGGTYTTDFGRRN